MNCAKNVYDNDKAVQCDLFEQPQSKKKSFRIKFYNLGKTKSC